MDDQLLIEMVSKYNILYDKSTSGFKNKPVKDKTWAAIGATLGCTGMVAQNRFRVLRDRYVRIKKQKLSEDNVDEFQGEWELIPHLSFLDNHIRLRERQHDNMSTSQITEADCTIWDIKPHDLHYVENIEEQSSKISIVTPIITNQKRKGYVDPLATSDDGEQDMSEQLSSASNICKESLTNSVDQMFGQYIALEFSNIKDNSKKLKLRADIVKLIYEAQRGSASVVYVPEQKKKEPKAANKRLRKYGVRPGNQNRKEDGHYKLLFLQMKETDPEQFFKYTRMNTDMFDMLLRLLTLQLTKESAIAIKPEERLAITLNYLSQGGTQQALAWSYSMGKTTVHKIIMETCEILWNVLSPLYLKAPNTADQWMEIASSFENNWNFPHCIGALDGKHVAIKAPKEGGSVVYSFKKHFSVVLMGVCDANYCFTLVDVGNYGSISDGGVLQSSHFGKALKENVLNVPQPSTLRKTDFCLPYCLVADAAFPLCDYIMRPYPGSNLSDTKLVFNYRLLKARRPIDNTFGILVARWRILRNVIDCNADNAIKLIKACVILHNFVTKTENEQPLHSRRYCPPDYIDHEGPDGTIIPGNWRNQCEPLRPVGRLSANNAARRLYTIRDNLAEYFVSEPGEIPDQYNHIYKGSLPTLEQ